MKQKSTSQSAFFNLRVSIGLFVVLTGVFLAVIGLGAFSGLTASSAKAQQAHKIINVAGLPPGFDCATIHDLGIDSISHPTQSETYTNANPDNPNQMVVTYNDSRTASANYSGASYSSDGGTTFTRLNPSPFASGHGTNFGDPVTLYNKPTSTFFGIFLATACGGQGIGSWKSTDGGV